MGLEAPCFRETDSELLEALVAGSPGGIGLDELRARGFAKVDLGFGDSGRKSATTTEEEDEYAALAEKYGVTFDDDEELED